MKTLRLLLSLLALAAAFFCAACTTTTIRDPKTGLEFKRASFLTKQSIGELEVRPPAEPGGIPTVLLKGYSNEQTETAAAVAAAVARAMVVPK